MYLIQLSLLLGILTIAMVSTVSTVQAGIYQCVNAKGQIEFRDRPCETNLDQETFLPIAYSATDTDPKTIAKAEKSRKVNLKKLTAKQAQAERKEERQKLSREKKLAAENLKVERLRVRCLRIDEKLQGIDEQLRRGVRVKRSIRLQQEREHLLQMKRRYCQALPKF
jgi:hypothetical protein